MAWISFDIGISWSGADNRARGCNVPAGGTQYAAPLETSLIPKSNNVHSAVPVASWPVAGVPLQATNKTTSGRSGAVEPEGDREHSEPTSTIGHSLAT